MAIDRDAFEELPADRRTNAERALGVLLSDPDAAFRAAELGERAGVADNSINAVLARLADRGLVEHRRPYWAIADPDALAAEAVEPADEVLSDLADPDEWLALARSLLGGGDP